MKVKIHPQDLEDICELNMLRKEIKDRVCQCMLGKSDVKISWNDHEGDITVEGKDIIA